LMYVCRNIIHL